MMRNTIKNIISSVALAAVALSFASAAMAQTSGSEAAVRYDKKISGPNENGVYTIELEAYVTGKVTVEAEAAPADIVLVLDYSTSMYSDISGRGNNSFNNDIAKQNQRISLLRNSVKQFVDIVKTNNESLPADSKDYYGGHRIAFVLFSGEVYSNSGLNTFINAEYLTTTEPSGSGNSYSSARVDHGTTSLLGYSYYRSSGGQSGQTEVEPSPSKGTNSDVAMQSALSILQEQDYTTKAPNRSRVVVFFTDGAPGGQESSNWYTNTGRIAVADGCIGASYTIKTTKWNDLPTTVYAIGMFSDATSATAASTYLSFTSSDYPKKDSAGNIIAGQEGNEMPKYTSGGRQGQGDPDKFVPVSGEKSVIVTTSGALDNVFSDIASSSADTYSAASSSSVMVDIVASNFQIPSNTDLGSVKTYQVACTQTDPTSLITFSSVREEITLYERDKDGNIVYEEDGETPKPGLVQNGDEVTVTGFDYGANWCGVEQYDDNGTIRNRAHGYKLVLEIPITVKDDIVGGPSVETNAPGSKLVIKDSDGNEVSSFDFVSPVVKIPVTIWIKKEGLNGYDSAIFTLRKTKFLGIYETDAEGNILMDGDTPKRIDYTYVKDQTKKYTVEGAETEMKWETFTKLAVNLRYNAIEDDSTSGLVKISGLDPNYIYRIEEDAWAHLGYTFDPNATARYTMEWDSATNSYKDVQNPFVFTNTSKGNVYAEDVVRNVFGQGSGTGQGLTTSGTSSGSESSGNE